MSFRESIDLYARPRATAAEQHRELRSYSVQSHRRSSVPRAQQIELAGQAMQIPLSAHPAQVVAAYQELVRREVKRRGLNNSVDQLKAMREETLAIRRETAAFENENRILRARIVKTQENQQKIMRSIAQLKAQPLNMRVFERKDIDYNLADEKPSPDAEKVTALREKLQEIYQANLQLVKSIEAAKEACKAQRLGKIKESFKMYYTRFQDVRQENQELEKQIAAMSEENQLFVTQQQK